MGYLFSLNALRQVTLYRRGGSLSTMSNKSSAELRLSLSDLIADTIYQFLDHENETPDDKRENKMATEDAAESILNIIGFTANDGPGPDGEIEATLAADIPDEFIL